MLSLADGLFAGSPCKDCPPWLYSNGGICHRFALWSKRVWTKSTTKWKLVGELIDEQTAWIGNIDILLKSFQKSFFWVSPRQTCSFASPYTLIMYSIMCELTGGKVYSLCNDSNPLPKDYYCILTVQSHNPSCGLWMLSPQTLLPSVQDCESNTHKALNDCNSSQAMSALPKMLVAGTWSDLLIVLVSSTHGQHLSRDSDLAIDPPSVHYELSCPKQPLYYTHFARFLWRSTAALLFCFWPVNCAGISCFIAGHVQAVPILPRVFRFQWFIVKMRGTQNQTRPVAEQLPTRTNSNQIFMQNVPLMVCEHTGCKHTAQSTVTGLHGHRCCLETAHSCAFQFSLTICLWIQTDGWGGAKSREPSN